MCGNLPRTRCIRSVCNSSPHHPPGPSMYECFNSEKGAFLHGHYRFYLYHSPLFLKKSVLSPPTGHPEPEPGPRKRRCGGPPPRSSVLYSHPRTYIARWPCSPASASASLIWMRFKNSCVSTHRAFFSTIYLTPWSLPHSVHPTYLLLVVQESSRTFTSDAAYSGAAESLAVA